MADLTPIPTNYAGVTFRSRLEARWAVFFDEVGIAWQYEKEGYQLPGGIWYLPDFWLPQIESWAEIKPREFTDAEKNKCKLLADGGLVHVYMLVGTPSIWKTDEVPNGYEFYHNEGWNNNEGRRFMLQFCINCIGLNDDGPVQPQIDAIHNKAESATRIARAYQFWSPK